MHTARLLGTVVVTLGRAGSVKVPLAVETLSTGVVESTFWNCHSSLQATLPAASLVAVAVARE
jgi:hypothetical protein